VVQGFLRPLWYRPLLAAALVAILAAVAAPRRFVVEGLSMAPGLMPGAVVSTGWFPFADLLASPGRQERWVVEAPTTELAIKRVSALPGEDVRILSGDLLIDGRPILKPPPKLAELAVTVPLRPLVADARLELEPLEVLDDSPLAREVNRPLEPVVDVGLSALVSTGDASGRIVVDMDSVRICWRVDANVRIVVVAGRLDGHLVGVAWRTRRTSCPESRSPFPFGVPDAWSFTRPRRGGSEPDVLAPHLRMSCDPRMRIEMAALWRDIQLRPAAGGPTSWSLGPNEYLLLGDFPTASVDSRQWGPVARDAILQRVRPSR